jgi:hypothetical protein
MSTGPKSPPESKRGPAKGAAEKADSGAGARRERLAQALRDNLKKRKAQQRQRREGGS